MIIDKTKRALELSRQDLCFAIQYMSDNVPYSSRLFGTVVFITKILDDRNEFVQYMAKNGMSCPDCTNKSHLRPCDIHGYPSI